MDTYTRDIEETDEVLDAEVGDPVNFWEEKQKELVTSTVDYNLSTLVDLIVAESIDLSPKYQRRFRWDDNRKSALIESFLMNVPVPPVFLNEDNYGQYSVIDGKQRLSAVFEFLRGRLRLTGLKVFSDINGKTFDDLPTRLQAVIKTRPTLRAIIILRQSDDDVKFEVFERLNTGGVKANPQEIRNSAYRGPLNDRILELSTVKDFHDLLGIKDLRSSAMYQEMRDAELVLRFMSFKDVWETFSGSMRRHLDRYMLANQRMGQSDIDKISLDFLQTLKVVRACFGGNAFRRWDVNRGVWRKPVLASIYDAQMIACKDIKLEKVADEQEDIIERFKSLFAEDSFRKSIDAQTNTPIYFRRRIQDVSSLLKKYR